MQLFLGLCSRRSGGPTHDAQWEWPDPAAISTTPFGEDVHGTFGTPSIAWPPMELSRSFKRFTTDGRLRAFPGITWIAFSTSGQAALWATTSLQRPLGVCAANWN